MGPAIYLQFRLQAWSLRPSLISVGDGRSKFAPAKVFSADAEEFDPAPQKNLNEKTFIKRGWLLGALPNRTAPEMVVSGAV